MDLISARIIRLSLTSTINNRTWALPVSHPSVVVHRGPDAPRADRGELQPSVPDFSCVAFTPLDVNAQGLGFQGMQFNYHTPTTISANLSLQYSLTRTLSAQAAYVYTRGNHIQIGPGDNNVTTILPAGASTNNAVPFPDFGHGSSYVITAGTSNYNSLQTKLEQQFGNGLQFLVTYTWSKTLGDDQDQLNGGSVAGYRAPDVPGYGVEYDYGPLNYDIRNVFHASGGYELPFGTGKKYFSSAGKLENGAGGRMEPQRDQWASGRPADYVLLSN